MTGCRRDGTVNKVGKNWMNVAVEINRVLSCLSRDLGANSTANPI